MTQRSRPAVCVTVIVAFGAVLVGCARGGPPRGESVHADTPASERAARGNGEELPPSPANSVAGDMVRVDGGTFIMGSPATEEGRDRNEGPQHRVTLSSFSIAKHEVTVGEFSEFVEATGYRTTVELTGEAWFWNGQWWSGSGTDWKNPGFPQNDRHPVVCLSWYDAVAYCNWRSLRDGKQAVYTFQGIGTDFAKWPEGWNTDTHDLISLDRDAEGYRLSTEAEWEYAARGGLESKGTLYAGTDDPKVLNRYGEDWRTEPVGNRAANELGLYDMSGNAWEWCQDWYREYTQEEQIDPIGQADPTQKIRIIRGGGWRFDAVANLRVANRGYDSFPTFVTVCSGFRLVLQQKAPN